MTAEKLVLYAVLAFVAYKVAQHLQTGGGAGITEIPTNEPLRIIPDPLASSAPPLRGAVMSGLGVHYGYDPMQWPNANDWNYRSHRAPAAWRFGPR